MDHLFPYPKMGTSFLEILHDPLTRKLLGFDAVHAEKTPFISGVTSRLKFLLHDTTTHLSFLKIGYTALEAFLQANCTGPPLDFRPEESVFPEIYRDDDGLKALRNDIFQHLAIDGCGPYPLTPHIELFWLAQVVMSNPVLAQEGFNGRRARFRVNFWHQKLLSEESPSLRDALHADAEILERQLSSRLAFGGAAAEQHFVEFLVERAVIRTHYGDDGLARQDLAHAATTRHFHFALSGALGKRTKFQDRDISQLVVLAKSRDDEHEPESHTGRRNSSRNEGLDGTRRSSGVKSPPPVSIPEHVATLTGAEDHDGRSSPAATLATRPDDLPLNDDTLLERIDFTQTQPTVSSENMTQIASSETSLPAELTALNPADQPLLFPIDSIILLTTASSISNTSPSDGLVREETLPYATRVLDGGSSNWQVYTQALLVRSRIEGYRSRTAERGLLQLQALVDQVIAELSGNKVPSESDSSTAQETSSSSTTTTFLPKPSTSESASVAERLKYIYQLSPPLRWELEAELAARWTSMGGLKTALEIYERLQMQAEVALCLAATDREAEAIALLKSILFEEVSGGSSEEPSEKSSNSPKTLKIRSPQPAETPRLLCILGDITSDVSYYKISWTASGSRYARAQRSLGRHFHKQRDHAAAADAFTLALSVSKLDRTSWFSLGCTQLELSNWGGAVESFTRCVQLEDTDAESWSNLAVALLKLPAPTVEATPTDVLEGSDDPQVSPPPQPRSSLDDEDESIPPSGSPASSPYLHVYSALRALRRAATLKRDDARIWDNFLTVAASIPPSAGTPWNDIIQAMGRVIDLRGKKEGERSVDLAILKVLVEFITREFVYPAGDGDGSSGGRSEEIKVDEARVAEGQKEGEGASGGEVQPPPDASTSTPTPTQTETTTTPPPTTTRLPHLASAFLRLIDTQILPLATHSAVLYSQLSTVSQWRQRPTLALTQAETSWRLHLTHESATEDFTAVTQPQWAGVVDKTVWLMRTYRALGPLQRERTGGPVDDKWRFKARSAARRVLGRGKDAWEGAEDFERLTAEVDALKE